VRTDVDLKKVGQVADLPPDSTPIQIGTEGLFANQAFVVIGRIVYEYELGTWNEWHLTTNQGQSRWLSDAQQEYVFTALATAQQLPFLNTVETGQRYTWNKVTYIVSSITRAHYRGVEGELPFQYWDKNDVDFVDLRSETGDFATIDYSDDKPALYTGEMVEFEDLHLKNLRTFEGWS
jgi:hypothetical protein